MKLRHHSGQAGEGVACPKIRIDLLQQAGGNQRFHWRRLRFVYHLMLFQIAMHLTKTAFILAVCYPLFALQSVEG